MPEVHALLVTYRRPVLLAEMLEAISGQTHRPTSLWVLDNGNDPTTQATIDRSQTSGWATYVALSENLGPAGAIARGFELVLPEAADEDWVLLLDDNDPPWRNDLLERVLAVANDARTRCSSVGAVGVDGSRVDRRTGLLRKAQEHLGASELTADYLFSGYFPLYSVEAIRAAGPYASELFFGFEELEFGLRLQATGYRVLVAAELQAAAHATVSATRRERNVRSKAPAGARIQWRRYYNHRNLLRIYSRHRLWLPLICVASIVPAGAIARSAISRPREVGGLLRTYSRATFDAASGRMGRRVEVPW